MVKNPHANAGDVRDSGSIPGLGRSPEEGMTTDSNILSWKIPWAGWLCPWDRLDEPGRLQSIGLQRVGHD